MFVNVPAVQSCYLQHSAAAFFARWDCVIMETEKTVSILQTKEFSTMRKKAAALLLALVLCIGAAGTLPAAAAGSSSVSSTTSSRSGTPIQLTDEHLKLTVPTGLYAFTQNTDPSDPSLAKAGITNWIRQKQDMQQQNEILLICAPNSAYTIYLRKKDTSSTQKYYNMKDMSGTAVQSLMSELNKPESSVNGSDSIKSSSKRVTGAAGLPYVYVEMNGTLDNKKVQEAAYLTIANGRSYTLGTYREIGALTAPQHASLKALADSLQVTQYLPKQQESGGSAFSALFLAGPLLFLAALVAVLYIVGRVSRTHEKRRKAVMLERITDYRRRQEEKEAAARERGIPLAGPEVLVENTTKCVKKALQRFSRVDLLLNRKGTWIFLLIAAALCLFIATKDSSTLVRIFAILGAVFCVIYILRIPHKVFQAEDGTYRKMKTRKVRYQFRAEDFRVTGVSSGVYPYVQIAKVYETSRYFYLYLGANHVCLVNKHDFTKGTADDLRAILQKQCSNFKPHRKHRNK
ncbi:hypothetical protein B6259_08435 [Ruminococcaceae bacterium CPB6]|nr:hypothetical protein B6259_08435 [Ruminococcaceae bacterium CPB6]